MPKTVRAVLLIMSAVIAVRDGSAASTAIIYLQQTSDRFQKTVDVYTIADGANSHFAARGEFDSVNGGIVPAMDEISLGAPCPGITCVTATFDPRRRLGRWYWMNGVLGATDRQPVPNWGFTPNAGYDLSGATTLRFSVRGKAGGEKVLFFCCGVGYDPDTGRATSPYPDSARRVSLPVQATTSWVEHQIDLRAAGNLSYVLGGFGWVASATGDLANPNPITFYLTDIRYDKPRPNDPRLLVSYETIKSSNLFDTVPIREMPPTSMTTRSR